MSIIDNACRPPLLAAGNGQPHVRPGHRTRQLQPGGPGLPGHTLPAGRRLGRAALCCGAPPVVQDGRALEVHQARQGSLMLRAGMCAHLWARLAPVCALGCQFTLAQCAGGLQKQALKSSSGAALCFDMNSAQAQLSACLVCAAGQPGNLALPLSPDQPPCHWTGGHVRWPAFLDSQLRSMAHAAARPCEGMAHGPVAASRLSCPAAGL